MNNQQKVKLTLITVFNVVLLSLFTIYLVNHYSLYLLLFTIASGLLMLANILVTLKYYALDENHRNIERLSYHIKRVGAETFNNLPIITLIYNDKLRVEWANSYAKRFFDKKLVNKHLSDIDKSLYEKLSLTSYLVEINERIFEVQHRMEIKTLYLIDITGYEQKIRKYEEKELVIGYLVFDNLEEAISDFTDQKRYMFLGRVNTTLMDYAQENEIMLKSYGEGKYIMLLEAKVLQKLIANKFEILTKIRKVSDQFETNLTISIGLATSQEHPVALNDKAMEALELTQSRGGDQVAIKFSDTNVKFFGGKSNIIEKRNKVRARVVATELDELMDECDKVIIMGHKIPDVDAFGSCVGILNIANRKERSAYIVIENKEIDYTLSKVFTYLQDNNSNILSSIISPQVALDLITPTTLLVIVDTQNPNLVIEPRVLTKSKHVVVIDHHRRGTNFIEAPDLIYTEMYASSSVELIAEIIEYYPVKVQINEIDATIMLAGMIVDTNNFTYRTGTRTFEAASFLRKHGADTLAVQSMLRESYQEHMMRAMLFEKVVITDDNMAIVVADNIGYLTNVKLAQTADWLLMIENVKASFVIGQLDENTVGVSARSFGEVNVQIIMEKMYGGGHFNNAATQIKDRTLQEVYDLLSKSIKEYLKELELDESDSTK